MTKSTKWFLGILGVLALFALLSIVLFFSVIDSAFTVGDTPETVVVGGPGGKIGLVELTGTIVSSDEVVRQLKKYRDDSRIRAILLRIDSPGGAVVPSQEMYEEVRKTRDGGKPVVVSMGSIAASGGYYVACGASRVVANRGSLTGSIGVISEFLQLRDALDKLGVGSKTVKSGRMKDAGSPMKKMTPEEEAYFQALIDNVHRQFITVVATERKLESEKVAALADGRVFTGEQAMGQGLVDTLGTFEDAVRITADMVGIEGEPSLVKERRRRSWFGSFLSEAIAATRGAVGEVLDRPVLSYRFVGPGGN